MPVGNKDRFMANERRVVITGCGVATPFGVGVESLWDGLTSGKSGIRKIEAYDPGGFDSVLGAEVPELKTRDYIPKNYRKSVKVMARDIELAVACAYEAVKDAGLVTKCIIDRGESEGPVTICPTRFGANIGAGLICADIQELAGSLQTSGNHDTLEFDFKQWGQEGMTTLTPLWLLKFLPNMLGCHVTIVHDAQAPSNTITCGEASSHLAIGEAYRTIARGAADVCMCGGAESKMIPMSVMRQQVMGRLVSGHDDTPDQACKPFGSDTDGMVAGEGGGLLILEELESAKARGARIYCEVAGFGAASKITSWHEPDPSGRALSLAIKNALADADLSPDQVNLLCTMGTGINRYDEGELAGIRTAFDDRKNIPAIANKGAVGMGGAGCGSIDLAATTMAMHHNTIPPSKNASSAQTGGLLQFAESDPVDARIDVAVSHAYSLSGAQTAAVVLRRYEA